jgi:hypothetical protein
MYIKKTSWCELYWPSDRRLSAKSVPNFADRGCHVVSVTDPYGSILDFLDRSRYFFFQVGPQLYSWGWVDPVPDPLHLWKSGSAGNRNPDLWICSQKLWPLDHRGGQHNYKTFKNIVPVSQAVYCISTKKLNKVWKYMVYIMIAALWRCNY